MLEPVSFTFISLDANFSWLKRSRTPGPANPLKFDIDWLPHRLPVSWVVVESLERGHPVLYSINDSSREFSVCKFIRSVFAGHARIPSIRPCET